MQRASGKNLNTVANYEWAVRRWLVPTLGSIPIAELRADDVEDVLLAEGRARNTMVRVRSVLSQALSQAARRGDIARDVAGLALLPGGARRQGRSLTVEQATTLLEAAAGRRLEALVVVGLLLGLRPGELAGLRWADVDLEAGLLSVRNARVHTPAGPAIGPTKEEWSRRTLEMPVAAVEALRRHRDRQAEERMRAGARWQDHDLVFPTSVGTPYDRWGMRRRFLAITRRAGLGDWQPKELRHSFVSLLSAARVPIEEIADLVGHRNARITAEIYRHRVHPTVGGARPVMDVLFPPTGDDRSGRDGGVGDTPSS